MSELARAVQGMAPGVAGRIRHIGVSVPGMVSQSGSALLIPSLPAFAGFNPAEAIEDRLQCPVQADNDCNLGARAELWLSHKEGSGLNDFVFLEIGDVGVGAGLVLNGGLYRGHDGGFAAEVGHMVLDSSGPVCSCGRRGCWELLVCDSATWGRYNSHSRFSPARFALLCQKAINGDAAAISALETTARALSLGISNIVLILNPEVVVVAGQITEAWDLVAPIIERESVVNNIHARLRRARRSAEELFLQGALNLALDQIFARPESIAAWS